MGAKFQNEQEKAFNRESLSDLLFEGIRQLHLQLDQKQYGQLLDYLALLHRWNGVYNLTAIREPSSMVQQHLLDSLAVVPAFKESSHVMDVGSGGGLPGMVLAIAKPDLKVDLIDAVKKKTAFLNQAKVELGLKNVEVHSKRVESLRSADLYDTITSRAFSALGEMIKLTQHLLAPGGQYIAMKGEVPEDEIKDLPQGWKVEEVSEIKVPGLNAKRHLIFIKRNDQ